MIERAWIGVSYGRMAVKFGPFEPKVAGKLIEQFVENDAVFLSLELPSSFDDPTAIAAEIREWIGSEERASAKFNTEEKSEMTVSVNISVNGNYKLPVSYKQGDREEAFTISGRGHDGPNSRHIPFNHGADAMTLSVGPESPDNGDEQEA